MYRTTQPERLNIKPKANPGPFVMTAASDAPKRTEFNWSCPGDDQPAHRVIATPQGPFPAGIFFTTVPVATSITETSFDGPFAV